MAYDDDPSALSSQGADLYSGLALHYYPGTLPPNNSIFSAYSAVANAVPKAEAVGGTLWLTEARWTTLQVTAAQQARNWVDTVLDALTAGASHVFLFTQIYPGSGFSEEHPNLTPKMAYPALAALNRQLAGYAPDGRLLVPTPLIADAFTDGTSTLVALWTTAPNAKLSLSLGSVPIEATDCWIIPSFRGTGR